MCLMLTQKNLCHLPDLDLPWVPPLSGRIIGVRRRRFLSEASITSRKKCPCAPTSHVSLVRTKRGPRLCNSSELCAHLIYLPLFVGEGQFATSLWRLDVENSLLLPWIAGLASVRCSSNRLLKGANLGRCC